MEILFFTCFPFFAGSTWAYGVVLALCYWLQSGRARHVGFEQCGHGLTARPGETSSVGFFLAAMLLVIFEIFGSDLVCSCRCVAMLGMMVVKAIVGAIERMKFMFAGLTVQNSALLTELLKVLGGMLRYLSVSDFFAFVVGMQLRSDGLVTDSSGLQMDEGDSLATISTDLGKRHVAAGCSVQVVASGRVDVRQEVDARSLRILNKKLFVKTISGRKSLPEGRCR